MTVVAVETFYGILALVGWVVILGLGGLRLVAAATGGGATVVEDVRVRIGPHALWMAFIVAVLATIGSLYFSEIAHFEPCLLCWYQRIAMYPLVVILGLAAWRGDGGAWVYATALAAIGAAISTYHVLLEWFPALSSGACDPDNPCTLVWFRVFGFISLPTLALTAFLLIITLVSYRRST
jgi:disulfide bond formation protein DsbB